MLVRLRGKNFRSKFKKFAKVMGNGQPRAGKFSERSDIECTCGGS